MLAPQTAVFADQASRAAGKAVPGFRNRSAKAAPTRAHAPGRAVAGCIQTRHLPPASRMPARHSPASTTSIRGESGQHQSESPAETRFAAHGSMSQQLYSHRRVIQNAHRPDAQSRTPYFGLPIPAQIPAAPESPELGGRS